MGTAQTTASTTGSHRDVAAAPQAEPAQAGPDTDHGPGNEGIRGVTTTIVTVEETPTESPCTGRPATARTSASPGSPRLGNASTAPEGARMPQPGPWHAR
jgi:hypothetical protein